MKRGVRIVKLLFTLLCSFAGSILMAQDYPTHITVAKDGTGDFTTIQEAICSAKAFPDYPIRIEVKAGVYREKVHVFAWNTNLSIIGDAGGKTVISFDDHFGKIHLGRNSTFHTATFKVEANDFYASDLTIENTAGDIGQALAIFVEGDRVVFERCELLGNQDTMYLTGENFRNYFIDCLITGTTDFIFGNATALFEKCEIRSKKASYITAASTPKEARFGFVFKKCQLTNEGVPNNSTYLGRPWRKYAQTVFIQCHLEAHIHPEGWKEWNAEGTAKYGEFKSVGPGASVNSRVPWSKQLTQAESQNFTREQIFRGWKPMN
jgi:pectinesterase